MKSRYRRLFALLLVLLFLTGSMPLNAQLCGFTLRASAETIGGSCGENMAWNLDTLSGTLTISGTGKMVNYSWAGDTPWYDYRSDIRTVEIAPGATNIGSSAFEGCRELTAVTIPDGVTSIGTSVFYGCKSLSSVTIPSSVTVIGAYTFEGCTSLSQLTIPNGLQKLDYNVFFGCSSLSELTIPDTVTVIGGFAFDGCSALTSITIPDSVTDIGSSAFEDCTNLSEVRLGSGVANIHGSSFAGCTSLAAFSISADNASFACDEDGVLFNKTLTTLVAYPCGKTQMEYVVPSSVTMIAADSFMKSLLTQVVVPDAVTTIGSGAFFGVGNVVYSGSAKGTPWGAKIVNGAVDGYFTFEDATKQTLVGCSRAAQGVVTIPEGVSVIADYALQGCAQITEILFPQSLTELREGALMECTNLQRVVIPGNVSTIGMGAFSFCYRLTQVTLTQGIGEIEQQAFYLTGLTAVHIPASVHAIGGGAFACATTEDGTSPDAGNYILPLQSITVAENNPYFSSSDGVLYDKTQTELIQYPAGKEGTVFYVPDGVEQINSQAFLMTWDLKKLVLPASVTEESDWIYSLAEERAEENDVTIYVPQSAEWASDLYVFDPIRLATMTDILPDLSEAKTNYLPGETIDLSGMKLFAAYSGGDTLLLPYTSFQTDETTLQTIGDHLVTVSYGGCSARVMLTVDAALNEASVSVADATVSASEGRFVHVDISLENNPGLIAAQLEIGYDPQQLRLVGAQNGDIFNASSFQPDPHPTQETYTLTWNDADAQTNYTDDGVLATLTFAVQETAVSGETLITITCNRGATFGTDQRAVALRTHGGSITLRDRLAGDTDGDGEVDLADAAVICRYLVGGWDVEIDTRNADVDGNGVVNLRDAVLIRRYLVGGWGVTLI